MKRNRKHIPATNATEAPVAKPLFCNGLNIVRRFYFSVDETWRSNNSQRTVLSSVCKNIETTAHYKNCQQKQGNVQPISKLFCTGYVPVTSKLQHLPRATPRAFEFLENFCSNSPSRGRKAVQIPHHRSIPGDQMSPSPGNFSVAFIMLRKLQGRTQRGGRGGGGVAPARKTFFF